MPGPKTRKTGFRPLLTAAGWTVQDFKAAD
jgi:hypothetical protein